MRGTDTAPDSERAAGGRHDGGVLVPSSDNVRVAVHEFGGRGRPLLLSHATGFHGYCYLPIADELGDECESFALDYRGHGDTARPDDWVVDWNHYGDDALAVAEALAPHGGLVGFGHSMGGAGLLMAALRNPSLFDALVVFEPIVFPPRDPSLGDAEPPSLAVGARKRRATFASFDEAVANYASKPPMMAFDPDVLRLYVAHGFRPSPEGVRLKCDPEHEAATFETGGLHRMWDRLAEIEVPVVVMAGADDGMSPATIAPRVAEQLANATFVYDAAWNHFTPFIEPPAIAAAIRAVL